MISGDGRTVRDLLNCCNGKFSCVTLDYVTSVFAVDMELWMLLCSLINRFCFSFSRNIMVIKVQKKGRVHETCL